MLRYAPLNYNSVESCCKTLLNFMNLRMEELKESIATLNALVMQDVQPYASQFLTLVNKCYIMVDDLVKTPKDKEALFFTHNFKMDVEEQFVEVTNMFKK